MQRRSLSLVTLLLLVVLAVPLSASQFVEVPFDQVARESALIVRGTIGDTFSRWDDAHQVIYTYATVRVHRYFGEATGPDVLVIREAGGTVDGYTMEAIGFPEIRAGEDVVLMLSQWEGSQDFRIHAYNQGKFLVRNRGGIEVLINDPSTQGAAGLDRPDGGMRAQSIDDIPGLTMAEFAEMVDASRAGRDVSVDKRQ